MKGVKVLKGDPYAKKEPQGRVFSNIRMRASERLFAKRIIAGGALHLNSRHTTARMRKIKQWLKRKFRKQRLEKARGNWLKDFFNSLFHWRPRQ